MTAPAHPCRRNIARLGVLGAALVTAVAVAAPAPPAGANGLTWSVRWWAPITSAGPNPVAGPPQLSGTASPPVAGDPSRVDYSVTSSGLPAACAVPAGAAALDRQIFRFAPALVCNGTYTVSVVARAGTGVLSSASAPLTAPLSLADPGPAPGALSGAVDGRANRVAVSWSSDPDPDVVGYRIRRDGRPVGEVAAGTRAFSDRVPGPGRYAYDVQALRWGAGGPGSASIASPPSAPLPVVVEAGAPTAPVTDGGGGTSPGGSSPFGGSGPSPGGPLPVAPTVAPTLPVSPAGPTGTAAAGSRSTYRSGGTISPTPPGVEADTYAERLPYDARDTAREVELADPDTTRTVARTVAMPGRSRPGLLVPMAVVLVLVAASLQIRSFLSRTAPPRAASAGEVGGPPPLG